MKLVGSKLFSEFGRGNAKRSFEGSRKVALVKETSCCGNFADRLIRIGQFTTCEFNSQTPYVLSNGATAYFAKRLGQINRKPGKKKPGQCGDAVLTQVDSDQHTMA